MLHTCSLPWYNTFRHSLLLLLLLFWSAARFPVVGVHSGHCTGKQRTQLDTIHTQHIHISQHNTTSTDTIYTLHHQCRRSSSWIFSSTYISLSESSFGFISLFKFGPSKQYAISVSTLCISHLLPPSFLFSFPPMVCALFSSPSIMLVPFWVELMIDGDIE